MAQAGNCACLWPQDPESSPSISLSLTNKLTRKGSHPSPHESSSCATAWSGISGIDSNDRNDRPRYYVTCRVCLWYYFVCNVYILSFTLLYGPFEVRPRRWRSLSPNPIDYNHYGGSSMNLLSLPYGHKLRAHDLWPCPVRGCPFHFSAMGHLLRQASSQRSPRWYFV